MGKEISQTILVLSAEPRKLLPAEQFLVNRGWAVTVTGDEKIALNLLIQHRPSFFLISVLHKNKKVRTLHNLVKQTFPDLCVVMFAETNTIDSYRLLLETRHPYRVAPPVTGPSIERAVNRFLKDAHERDLQESLYVKSLRRTLNGEDIGTVSWAPLPSDQDSLLSRGAGEAIESAVNRGDGVVRQAVAGKITNTACIVIESDRFQGYLIAAMAGDHPFDDKFIHLIRSRLVAFLRENGETVKDGESFPMKVREVEFMEWALDYAEFLKKTVHEGREIAFAFFPLAQVGEQVRVSAVAHMLTVQVDDLVPDETIDFNVHLHLPANQRFLLYAAKDSVFLRAQKERLVKSGVRELHIKKEDLAVFKRYRAKHRIADLIKDFEERQKFLAAG